MFWILPYFLIHNPWWQVLIGQLLMYSIITIAIIVILLMPTEGIEQPKIASYKDADNEWATEILKYNIDFGPKNKIINWDLTFLWCPTIANCSLHDCADS